MFIHFSGSFLLFCLGQRWQIFGTPEILGYNGNVGWGLGTVNPKHLEYQRFGTHVLGHLGFQWITSPKEML